MRALAAGRGWRLCQASPLLGQSFRAACGRALSSRASDGGDESFTEIKIDRSGLRGQTQFYASGEGESVGPSPASLNAPVPSTALGRLLARTIRASQPMSVAEFMKQCLTHNTLGYYSKSDVFGASGDFVTAPEVSQTFGELVGVWCVTIMHKLPLRSKIELVELGPGRGTMIADALRAIKTLLKSPRWADRLELHLVEASSKLREMQQAKLQPFMDEAGGGLKVHWFDSVHAYHASKDSFNAAPIFLAQEFFDALPVHQLVWDPALAVWREKMVAADEKDQLSMVVSRARTKACMYMDAPAYKERVVSALETKALPGGCVEICPEALVVMELVLDVMRRSVPGGSALVIDYGNGGPIASSVRAIQRHQFQHILTAPGEADLTADVDFGALSSAVDNVMHSRKQGVEYVHGLCEHGMVTQADFLVELGIRERFQALAAKAGTSEQELAKLQKDFVRLVSPDEMGTVYKAWCTTTDNLSNIYGFSHRAEPERT
ncbi:Protein arginine methyltransferase NDUFAF7-like, mitochondrial [Porphyridium purpureum]|uniref:Protein arginine methyltransferase NDUFAF7 n=1 Tax=Porphyridium purpureum TaxID=35688 RepID=A0A5J4YXL9_PORPP|nr:Protein arginine methyltransferase NDUFAF7-like, mitochondrial [Porphyridium purpureum]|eukprot:POR5647..scf209_3